MTKEQVLEKNGVSYFGLYQDNSLEDVVACPYMLKTSNISEAPIFDPVALVVRLGL